MIETKSGKCKRTKPATTDNCINCIITLIFFHWQHNDWKTLILDEHEVYKYKVIPLSDCSLISDIDNIFHKKWLHNKIKSFLVLRIMYKPHWRQLSGTALCSKMPLLHTSDKGCWTRSCTQTLWTEGAPASAKYSYC